MVGFDSADTVPPKFVSLSIDSNNLNAAFAKTNDDITVNLTTDGTVSSADATILGRTVQTTISGNSVTFDTSVILKRYTRSSGFYTERKGSTK